MIEQINSNNFKQILAENPLVVVDFFAPWCGPCAMMHPIVEECAKNHPQIKFVKIDIDSATDLAIGQNVQVVPTFIAYKNGVEVDRTIGYTNMQGFKQFLQNL